MSLIIPLGLLGLLAIAVLILIYIIKPNYQQKFISSTYVWKLSLKYRKKKIPVSRLKNILIFICQMLILISCALLLAQPVIATEKVELSDEKVIIIDASVSMLALQDDETRFERAVLQVQDLTEETLGKGGVISVIIADDNPYFLAQRADKESLTEINEQLDNLITPGSLKCTFGSADMDEAAALADAVLTDNPDAEVILYTATNYTDKGQIKVVDVSESGEWNAAILNCTAKLEDNYYNISIDVGCFGKSKDITVICDVYNANNSGQTVNLQKTEFFDNYESTRQTITFTADEQLSFTNESIYSFDYIHVYVEEDDSLTYDNFYYVYGGTKPTVKIQYVSTSPCPFFRGILMTMREQFKTSWNIEFVELSSSAQYKTEGYDFYLFEQVAPDKMPTDGVVFLVDPSKAPENLGISLGSTVTVNSNSTLASGAPHEITNNVNPDNFTVSGYRQITSHDNFEELMYYAGDPVFLVKNSPSEKIAVLLLDIHKSNMPKQIIDFSLMMRNMFMYFIPSTFSGSTFEVGDTVTLNSRAEILNVSEPSGKTYELTEFPGLLNVTAPGTYTFTQPSLQEGGEPIIESFYVSISNFESNITKEVDSLPTLHITKTVGQEDKDLLIYIAAALVALLFVEWWLQSREYF